MRSILRKLRVGQLNRVESSVYARFHAVQQLGTLTPAGSASLQHLTAVGGCHGDRFEEISGGPVAAALSSVAPFLQERTGRWVQGAAVANPALLRRWS